MLTRFMKHRFLVPVVGMAVGAVALIGCSSPSGSGSGSGSSGVGDGVVSFNDLDALIEAAQSEGELNYYSGDGDALTNAIVDAFEAEYGIAVNVQKLSAGELANRYQAEASSGHFGIDVLNVECSQGDFFGDIVDEGWAEPVEDLDIPSLASGIGAEQLRFNGATVITAVHPSGIAFNTDLIDPLELSSWEDVLNESYSGRIVMPDPESAFYHLAFLQFLSNEFGERLIEELGAQNLGSAASAEARNLVAAGQYDFFMSTSHGATQGTIDSGAPIDFVLPDVSTGMSMCTSLTAADKSEHPNASRLFVHFLTGPIAAAAIESIPGEVSPFGVKGLPDGYVPLPAPDDVDADRLLDLLGIE